MFDFVRRPFKSYIVLNFTFVKRELWGVLMVEVWEMLKLARCLPLRWLGSAWQLGPARGSTNIHLYPQCHFQSFTHAVNLFYLVRTFFTSPRTFFFLEKFLSRARSFTGDCRWFWRSLLRFPSHWVERIPPSQHVSGGPEISLLHHMVYKSVKVGSLKKGPFRQGPFFWTSCPSSPKSVAPALFELPTCLPVSTSPKSDPILQFLGSYTHDWNVLT